MRFRDIPQFISDGSYQVNVSWEYMMDWLDRLIKEEGLQLNPDFQRGHVWTEEQQIKFLEFILQGGKTPIGTVAVLRLDTVILYVLMAFSGLLPFSVL